MLRGKITDIMADQAEVKQGMRGVRALVREARHESRLYADVSGLQYFYLIFNLFFTVFNLLIFHAKPAIYA